MSSLTQKLSHLGQRILFKTNNNSRQPLLSNSEILELLLRIQHRNKTRVHNHDVSFRKIGEARSVFRGHGMDYEESRLYQAGDDPRYMNWALTARTGQHYLKVFREERQPGVFILVDRRNSMRFGTQQRLKITQAARTAAITIFSAQENNYSIGGVILDNEVEWFKENNNKQAAFDFIHQAARPALPVFEENTLQQQKLSDVLKTLNEILTKGSTLYLISDFHDLRNESQSTLLQLSSSHTIHAIHITDPAEIKLPKAGVVSLITENYNAVHQVNSDTSTEQNKYMSASNEYYSKIKYLFEDLAISYRQVFTTDDKIEV